MLSIYKIIYNKALCAKINDCFLSLTVLRGIRLGKNLQITYKHVDIQHIYETIMFKRIRGCILMMYLTNQRWV